MERNKHKGFKIFIIIFMGISLLIFSKIKEDQIGSILSSLNHREKKMELIDKLNNDDIFNINVYDGNIIGWKYNKIAFYKNDGKLITEKQLNFSEPEIYYGEKTIYSYDKEYGDIYNFDKKGETLDRLQLNKRIYNIKEDYGNLIIHFKNDREESLNILDKNKVLLGNYFFEGENILTYSVNKNGDKITIGTLDIKGDTIKSEIHFYGENNEKLSSINLEDEIVLYLNYLTKDETIALTDKSLYLIKDEKVLWKEDKDYKYIKDIIIEDKIYLLYSSYLDILDFDGTVINTIGFGEEYKKIQKSKENILVYGDKGLSILNNGENILNYDIDIIDAYLDKDKIYIFGFEDIKVFEIGDK